MQKEDVLLYCFVVAAVVIISTLLFAWRSFSNRLRLKDRSIKELTERLAGSERQLFHDKNELNAILSSMVEGVMVIASDQRILYVSPNLSQMLEMRSKEVTDKPYWEVIRHQEINVCLKDALQNKKAVNKEITFIGPEDVSFIMQISPVVQQERLTSVVAVFHDITQLKQLVKLRAEFVANVSHELKTPLTSIKGFSETLCAEGGLEDPVNARRFLEIIHKQSERLEMLVNDLLTLSAIESKEEKMDCSAQDLAPIIQSVLLMEKKTIDAASHHVTLNIPLDLPKIYVDRNRIEQVFINLLDNAVKFTPASGKINILAQVDNDFVRIDIKDSGVGIAPEHLNRVFERFYRADKARSGNTGTGLGLSIVKHIIQAHRGRVEVQSTSGLGSTFSIFLPLIK